MQNAVKGSQGAGRVDESLDSSIAGNEPVAEPSKPKDQLGLRAKRRASDRSLSQKKGKP